MLVPVLAWLACAWALVLVLDLWDLLGTRGERIGLLWPYLFNDRPTEWLAWVYLGLLIVISAFLAGRLWHTGPRGAAMFWLVFALGVSAMYLEDAGDVRHVLSKDAERWFGGAEGHARSTPQVLVEGAWFAVVAAVPLFALLRYGAWPWAVRRCRPYLVTGVALYAVAAVGSALRHVSELYIRVGETLVAPLVRGEMPLGRFPSRDRMHFLFVDGPIEESLELVAVALLLAAAVAYLRSLDPTPKGTGPTPES